MEDKKHICLDMGQPGGIVVDTVSTALKREGSGLESTLSFVWRSGVLPQSKHILSGVRLTADSKLALNGCLSLCVSPVTD